MRWHKALLDAGWVGIIGPRNNGGRGATLVEQYIHEEEVDRINAPGTINPVGLNIAGPTIMQWGADVFRTETMPRRVSFAEAVLGPYAKLSSTGAGYTRFSMRAPGRSPVVLPRFSAT
jgi:alkylation response protein AidB-like acyl-CoA dehydrogenase